MTDLLYPIAISLIPGIGSIHAKKLIAYTGSIDGVFNEKRSNLLKIPGIGEALANEIVSADVLKKASDEIEFINKHNINAYFYLNDDYPARLKNCADSPIVFFSCGNVNFNASKIISIVGTRKATDYGREFCDKLISEMRQKKHNPIIVSGLAYGIDIAAHKAALKYGLATIAVLGHGFKTLYPASHRRYAKDIMNQGALVTEFTSDTNADKHTFIKRNRIIAGLADATIVVESGNQGGALITADIANSYNRDVFAVPGKISDTYSCGCNKLIKANKANLLESIEDIEYLMGWETTPSKPKTIQKELFKELSEEEHKIMTIIKEKQEITIDHICLLADMPVSKVSPILLNLEFSGLLKSLPGKVYKPM